MKIVFVSAEVSPFAKTGGLGDVAGALPKALADAGHEVTVFMPFYRQAREFLDKADQPVERIVELPVSWSGWSAPMTLLRSTLPHSKVPIYFIGNDGFFDRGQIYANNPAGYDDHLERFTFFCRAVIAACGFLGLEVDILHCNDWHTALLPVYLHSGLRGDTSFRSAASIYTIHNVNYQGRYPAGRFGHLGLHSFYAGDAALEYFGDLNLMKAGIVFADEVTTVSPTYGREIQSPQFGSGLDGLLRDRAYKLSGILNGIDAEEWNPATDPLLPEQFDISDLSGKKECRSQLLRESGLEAQEGSPVIGFVSRLVFQKGLDLLLPALPSILQTGVRVVVLGSGESHYENELRRLEHVYRGALRSWIAFDNGLAHRIFAGSDLFVMPSLYEPCGLNQMYALRYGSLPVVRLTGGLADTIVPFDGSNVDTANGFGMTAADPEEFRLLTWIASLCHRDRSLSDVLQHNGMSADFSWDQSAAAYEKVYQRALARAGFA